MSTSKKSTRPVEKQSIRNPQKSYYHTMLNMEDDDLNPYQYRLLGHYRRVCGDGGTCWETTDSTAEKCQMSARKVAYTRKELEALGYIHLDYRDGSTIDVTLLDRMSENIARYSKTPSQEVRPTPAKDATPPLHDVQTKNKPLEEEPEKKKDSPDTAPPLTGGAGEKPAEPHVPAVEEEKPGWFDDYIKQQPMPERVKSLRNEKRPMLPDPRPKTGYKKSDAYQHLERIVKHVGEYKISTKDGMWLGQVLGWLWKDATGRDGKPATYDDALDFWLWIDKQGFSIKDPAKIKSEWWDKWKAANPTVASLTQHAPDDDDYELVRTPFGMVRRAKSEVA